MPYPTLKDLPESVRHVLPKHAQEIYLSSYNNAHAEYYSKKKRNNPEDSLESLCHKVAWTAVKKSIAKIKKENGKKRVSFFI